MAPLLNVILETYQYQDKGEMRRAEIPKPLGPSTFLFKAGFELLTLRMFGNNKCRPILVQGLRRDIEINFHNKNI